ncbi:hypothetical protein D9M68_490040 [compost metagenome]
MKLLSGKLSDVRAARVRTTVGELDRTLVVVESQELLAAQKRGIAVALGKAKVELSTLEGLIEKGRITRSRLVPLSSEGGNDSPGAPVVPIRTQHPPAQPRSLQFAAQRGIDVPMQGRYRFTAGDGGHDEARQVFPSERLLDPQLQSAHWRDGPQGTTPPFFALRNSSSTFASAYLRDRAWLK